LANPPIISFARSVCFRSSFIKNAHNFASLGAASAARKGREGQEWKVGEGAPGVRILPARGRANDLGAEEPSQQQIVRAAREEALLRFGRAAFAFASLARKVLHLFQAGGRAKRAETLNSPFAQKEAPGKI